MFLIGLATAMTPQEVEDANKDYTALIILGIVLGLILCCFTCCFGFSKMTSKPAGVNDRFSDEFIAKVDTWLAEEVAKGNENIVVHTDYQWPEENPVDVKVPDAFEVFI